MYFNAVCLDDMVYWDGAKALVTGSLTEAGDATEDFDKDWGGLLVSLLSRDGWGWREARELYGRQGFLRVRLRKLCGGGRRARRLQWGGVGRAAGRGGAVGVFGLWGADGSSGAWDSQALGCRGQLVAP